MAPCLVACGRPRPAAAAGASARDAEQPERLRLELHSADLARSFARLGGMDPYVVVSVEGREVYRSSSATNAHLNPRWEASFVLRAEGVPDLVDISVRSRNRLGRDVLCGTVALPCAEGMGDVCDTALTLRKRGEATGVLRVSLSPVVAAPTLLDDGPPKAALVGSSKSLRATCSSLMFDSTVVDDAANDVELADQEPSAPPALPEEDAMPEHEAEVAGDVAAPVDAESLQLLLGSWTCVATEGLDEFLKQAGLGAIQRRIAMAAKWPSWDFSLVNGHVVFVNHAQLGDLREEVVLDGSTYKHKDLQGHPLTCRAKWARTEDGGVLTIWRESEVGPFYETRRVASDTLEFVLTKEDGKFWGRTFKRA